MIRYTFLDRHGAVMHVSLYRYKDWLAALAAGVEQLAKGCQEFSHAVSVGIWKEEEPCA